MVANFQNEADETTSFFLFHGSHGVKRFLFVSYLLPDLPQRLQGDPFQKNTRNTLLFSKNSLIWHSVSSSCWNSPSLRYLCLFPLVCCARCVFNLFFECARSPVFMPLISKAGTSLDEHGDCIPQPITLPRNPEPRFLFLVPCGDGGAMTHCSSEEEGWKTATAVCLYE